MKAWIAIYEAHFKLAVATELQHRVASLIYQMSAVLQPVIYLVVWSTVARTRGGQLR